MKIERLLCDRQSFIKSRAPLEDNAYVLSHYDNGAVGRLWVLLGQRRQHGQPALPLRRLQGLGRVDRLAPRPADLRDPGRARPDPAPRHALSRGREPRRRPHGRAAHRGPRRQLGQHLPLDRPGDRREDARRRGLPRRPTTIRASRPAPRACAGSRTASARPTPARPGSTSSNRTVAKDKHHETLHLHRRDGRSRLHRHARQVREARRRGHRDDRRRLVEGPALPRRPRCSPTRARSRPR